MNYSRSDGAMILSSMHSGASLKQSSLFSITFTPRWVFGETICFAAPKRIGWA
jgi:hypothetical protein